MDASARSSSPGSTALRSESPRSQIACAARDSWTGTEASCSVPEGDTIHKAARVLAGALEGKTLRRFEAKRVRRDLWPQPGTRIAAVEAMGKNLLVRFADGRTLVTHMRMTGSWHVYRPGDRWHPAAARVSLEVDDAV